MNKLTFIILFFPIVGFGQILDTITICNGDSSYIFNNWEEQTGNYTDGVDITTLIVNPTPTVTGSFILNGNATQPVANTYQLTQAAGNQSGSAWNSVTLNLTQPFSFDVDVFLGYNNSGADGMAFLLQQVSTVVGTSGGGLGYQGISPSLAVEFDTWQNSSDPSYDHLAVQKNGVLDHNGAFNLVPFIGFPPGNSNIEDGLWHNVVFSWNPNTYNFKVVYDGVTLVNYTNNIVASIFGNNPNVYWGFTAATGGANNIQKFRVNSLGVQLYDETICYSDTIQIDPQVNTSLYSYLWTPNYDISNDTIPSPLFSPDTTTTYYLEITNTYGCSQTDSLTINVDNSASNITFPFPSQFCLGLSPINLNSATPIGGNYLVNNSASAIFSPNVNDIGLNTVTYSYTNSNGCSNSLTNNISVYDSPIALCIPTNASCNGFTDGSATLSISGGTPNYTSNWGGNDPTALGSGTYGYTVTDVNSCIYSDSVIIYEPEIFTASINTTIVSCNGGSNGTANIQLQGSSTPPGTVSTLTYCTSTPGSNINSTIDNIQLTGDIVSINNNTSGICDQYEDYTNLYADVTEGQSYTIDVDLGDCSNTNLSSGGKVYIDWNIDGDFSDPGEEVGVIAYGIASSASILITVPFSGAYGATRMRVVSQYQTSSNTNSTSSCDAGIWAPSYIEPWFGATEDYSIVISAANITATYNWSNGLTLDSISGLSAGNYSVDITNGNGCTLTNYITINEPAIITGTDNVGTHCDSYVWPINGIIYNTSNNTATTSLTANSGCDSIVTLNLIITNSTTTIDPQTACDSYTWIDGNTYTTSNNAATFTSTNAAGCINVATLNLNINNTTNSIDPQTACDSYTWIDGNTYTASNNSATFTSTNALGCDNIATLNLTINNTTNSIDPQTACDSYTWIDGYTYTASNNSATFTSTNALGCNNIATLNLTILNSTENTTNDIACDSYTWLVDGNTYTTTGIYTDTNTNAAGCTNIETLNLVVGYTDEVDVIIAENNISCFGYDDGSINLIPNGGTPPFQYSWNNGSANQNINALSAGNYSFTLTDSNGCKLDSIATINEANQIFLDFIATSPICRYDESTLSINISNSSSNAYTILLQDSILKSFIIDTNGLLIPEGIPITLSPNFSEEVYIVSLTDTEGCTGVYNDDVYIEVKQLPILVLNEEDICIGSQSFTLNNATPNGGFYSINDELTNYFDVENLGPGIYNIGYNYTDPISSCSNQINEVITISEFPKAGMIFSPQPTDIDNPNIYFRDNSNETVLYSEWNLGDGTIVTDETNFWHTYQDIGDYTIKYHITNSFGCTDSITGEIIINPIYSAFIPNSFTPNNDGNNDYFFPSIIGGYSYTMKIYNRWGEIIYDEENGRWNGKVNNNLVPNEIYSYSILINDFKDKPFIYTGIVTLIK